MTGGTLSSKGTLLKNMLFQAHLCVLSLLCVSSSKTYILKSNEILNIIAEIWICYSSWDFIGAEKVDKVEKVHPDEPKQYYKTVLQSVLFLYMYESNGLE